MISPSNNEEPAGQTAGSLTARERLMLLVQYNQDYLQELMEDCLSELPSLVATGLLYMVKSRSGGEIDRRTLWKIPTYVLSRMDDATFDKWRGILMDYLADL